MMIIMQMVEKMKRILTRLECTLILTRIEFTLMPGSFNDRVAPTVSGARDITAVSSLLARALCPIIAHS